MIFDRTFHPDEANQAFTAGRLLETGSYRYTPSDHHGPTLYYAAAAVQKSAGRESLAEMDGTLLRCTPLVFSALAVVLGVAAVRRISKSRLAAALFAVSLAASPVFVFFATDFIQEMLLAAFSVAAFWAAAHRIEADASGGKTARIRPGTWSLLAGMSAGLAFSTKETSILSFAAAAGAALAAASCRVRAEGWRGAWRAAGLETRDILLAVAGFMLVSVLFYSSFCGNWRGVYDAFVSAPFAYLGRASGSASAGGAAWHAHPWWKHLQWLFGGNPGFCAFAALGAACGAAACAMRRFRGNVPESVRTWFVFMLAYAVLLTAAYSAIPYKTPWCVLQMHIPLLAAATLGWSAFVRAAAHRRFAAAVLPAAAAAWMLCGYAKTLAAMHSDPDSKAIPYNYASASPEVKELAGTIDGAMSKARETSAAGMPFAAVALPPEDVWPLPWYNRAWEPQTGYWTDFEALRGIAAKGLKPSVVVVPMEEGHLVGPLFPHLKNTKRFYMRQGVRVRVFW